MGVIHAVGWALIHDTHVPEVLLYAAGANPSDCPSFVSGRDLDEIIAAYAADHSSLR